MERLEVRLGQLRLEAAVHPRTLELAVAEAMARWESAQGEWGHREEADVAEEEARLARELAEAQAELPRVREQVPDLFGCIEARACRRWRSVGGRRRRRRACEPCRRVPPLQLEGCG